MCGREPHSHRHGGGPFLSQVIRAAGPCQESIVLTLEGGLGLRRGPSSWDTILGCHEGFPVALQSIRCSSGWAKYVVLVHDQALCKYASHPSVYCNGMADLGKQRLSRSTPELNLVPGSAATGSRH
jgi:hypothetical protein